MLDSLSTRPVVELSALGVAGAGANVTVSEGSMVNVSVVVENVGGSSGSFDLSLSVGAAVEMTASTGELAAGGTETVVFGNVTEGLAEGTYPVTVSAADDSVSGEVTLEPLESVSLPDQNVTDATEVTFDGVVSDGVAALLLVTYEGDNGTVVAGVANRTYMNESVTMALESNVGFPDRYTAHLLPATDASSSYRLGDTLSANTTEAVVVSETARVSTVGGAPDVEVIEWTGSLAMFGDSTSGQTTVPGPELTLASPDYPDSIGPDENLEVGYTVENVGDATGIKSAIELVVDGSTADSTVDVTVGAGETATGTLTYNGSGGSFTLGETVQFTVELAEFGDTESGETSVEASAAFDVEIIKTNSPVVTGQELTVTAAVTNTGDIKGSSSVELSVGGLGTNSTTTTLGPGGSTQLSLGVTTGDGDAGNYTAVVAVGSVSDTAPVEVVADTGSPEFDVTDVQTNEPLVEGEELSVFLTVENIGDAAGTQEVTVSAAAFDERSVEPTLEPGAVTNTTVTVDTEIGSAGEYTLTVETGDRSTTETVLLSLAAMPGSGAPLQDDLCRDINGDSEFSIFDVQTFFNVFDDPAVKEHAWAYNLDGSADGQITVFDVQALFDDL